MKINKYNFFIKGRHGCLALRGGRVAADYIYGEHTESKNILILIVISLTWKKKILKPNINIVCAKKNSVLQKAQQDLVYSLEKYYSGWGQAKRYAPQ